MKALSIAIHLGIIAAVGIPVCVCASEHETTPLYHVEKCGSVAQDFEQQEEDIAGEDEQAELQLLACLVMAEAEGEDMVGKRLVVDTVLNRVDSADYPNTITEVIYDCGQFTPVTDGRLEESFETVSQDCFDAVSAELEERLDYDVLYFNAGDYSKYGQPAYQWGRHYFST